MESGKNTFLSRSSANSAHAGHRERLRRRALLEGIDDLRPHELLELLLYYAIPRRDVNALAHALDARFGGVRGVLGAQIAVGFAEVAHAHQPTRHALTHAGKGSQLLLGGAEYHTHAGLGGGGGVRGGVVGAGGAGGAILPLI